jgi:DHA1 family tetracycline resistance protein-like MFS transporter
MECQQGSDDAQYSATVSNFAMNSLSFLLNPVLGSLSDTQGRKPILLLSLALSVLPAAVLVVMVQTPTLPPFWYYTANASGGSTYFIGVAFATLSDVFPNQQFRASSYGLLLASFYGGFAVGPSMSLVLSSQYVASASFVLMMTSFWVAMIFLPESLSLEISMSNLRRSEERDERHHQQQQQEQHQRLSPCCRRCAKIASSLHKCFTRPFRELSVLNHSTSIRLVALASFFSSMVYASDVTLVVYYIIEQLNIRDTDLAQMFLIMGVVGVVFQGGLLPTLIQLFGGELRLLVATFACGIVHNSLYGMATGKYSVLLALLLAQFTKLNFPILSSIASKTASSREQGRMQGALFATNALASAFGPLSMEYVYGRTKSCSNWYGGPGTMFFFAAVLQAMGFIAVSFIPRSAGFIADEMDPDQESLLHCGEDESIIVSPTSNLEEPLLPSRCPGSRST